MQQPQQRPQQAVRMQCQQHQKQAVTRNCMLSLMVAPASQQPQQCLPAVAAPARQQHRSLLALAQRQHKSWQLPASPAAALRHGAGLLVLLRNGWCGKARRAERQRADQGCHIHLLQHGAADEP